MVIDTLACSLDRDGHALPTGDSDVATSADGDSAAETELDNILDFQLFPKHVLSELEADIKQPLEVIQFRKSLEAVTCQFQCFNPKLIALNVVHHLSQVKHIIGAAELFPDVLPAPSSCKYPMQATMRARFGCNAVASMISDSIIDDLLPMREHCSIMLRTMMDIHDTCHGIAELLRTSTQTVADFFRQSQALAHCRKALAVALDNASRKGLAAHSQSVFNMVGPLRAKLDATRFDKVIAKLEYLQSHLQVAIAGIRARLDAFDQFTQAAVEHVCKAFQRPDMTHKIEDLLIGPEPPMMKSLLTNLQAVKNIKVNVILETLEKLAQSHATFRLDVVQESVRKFIVEEQTRLAPLDDSHFQFLMANRCSDKPCVPKSVPFRVSMPPSRPNADGCKSGIVDPQIYGRVIRTANAMADGALDLEVRSRESMQQADMHPDRCSVASCEQQSKEVGHVRESADEINVQLLAAAIDSIDAPTTEPGDSDSVWDEADCVAAYVEKEIDTLDEKKNEKILTQTGLTQLDGSFDEGGSSHEIGFSSSVQQDGMHPDEFYTQLDVSYCEGGGSHESKLSSSMQQGVMHPDEFFEESCEQPSTTARRDGGKDNGTSACSPRAASDHADETVAAIDGDCIEVETDRVPPLSEGTFNALDCTTHEALSSAREPREVDRQKDDSGHKEIVFGESMQPDRCTAEPCEHRADMIGPVSEKNDDANAMRPSHEASTVDTNEAVCRPDEAGQAPSYSEAASNPLDEKTDKTNLDDSKVHADGAHRNGSYGTRGHLHRAVLIESGKQDDMQHDRCSTEVCQQPGILTDLGCDKENGTTAHCPQVINGHDGSTVEVVDAGCIWDGAEHIPIHVPSSPCAKVSTQHLWSVEPRWDQDKDAFGDGL